MLHGVLGRKYRRNVVLGFHTDEDEYYVIL
jgi:hypothetical protein